MNEIICWRMEDINTSFYRCAPYGLDKIEVLTENRKAGTPATRNIVTCCECPLAPQNVTDDGVDRYIGDSSDEYECKITTLCDKRGTKGKHAPDAQKS